jgi:Na+/H+ antiporter NhaD/arsenite permease-like protein
MIFLATYAVIGIQRIPRIHISRAAGALVGAVAMGVFGVLSLREIYAAIDLDTLTFLLGMMILVSYLEASGFFEVLEWMILRRARSGTGLLGLVILSSGGLSSLFMNDTICLMFTPVILRITARLGVSPAPYLMALVTSANIGSAMTLIGNPQNMLIGIRSGIPFLSFTHALWPVSAMGLAAAFAVIRWVYRRDLIWTTDPSALPPNPDIPVQRYLLSVSLGVMAVFLALLVAGYPPQAAAISLAAVMILLGSNRPRRPLAQVDWTLLLLFAGLFVVMRGVEHAGILDRILLASRNLWGVDGSTNLFALAGISVAASNMVSNVPAVLLLSPLAASAGDPSVGWLTLAMTATLAGNLTLVGSAANLIVVEAARQRGVAIGFTEYLRVGGPLTLVTMGLGLWWIAG